MSVGDFVFEEGQHVNIGFFHATIIKRERKEGKKIYTYLFKGELMVTFIIFFYLI